MKLSVVTTLYQSAAYIAEFHTRAEAAARTVADDDYQIVLVNDGSPDESLDLAIDLAEKDPHVVVVDLSRNFGHHRAIMTGLAQARGDLVFLIDSDLEEEPEWLTTFAERLKSEGSDVVYGQQARRKGAWFERISGGLFHRLFRWLVNVDLPKNVTTARLMTRRYVEALVRHGEREIFLAGLWHITGFRQVPEPVTKHATSGTTYTFGRKLSIAVDSVTSFSNAPLVFIFNLGVVISTFALVYILYLIIHWAFLTTPLSGWTSVMASVWLLGGMIISFVGVVGLYLSKIYSETKQRPYAIIRRIYGRNES